MTRLLLLLVKNERCCWCLRPRLTQVFTPENSRYLVLEYCQDLNALWLRKHCSCVYIIYGNSLFPSLRAGKKRHLIKMVLERQRLVFPLILGGQRSTAPTYRHLNSHREIRFQIRLYREGRSYKREPPSHTSGWCCDFGW